MRNKEDKSGEGYREVTPYLQTQTRRFVIKKVFSITYSTSLPFQSDKKPTS